MFCVCVVFFFRKSKRQEDTDTSLTSRYWSTLLVCLPTHTHLTFIFCTFEYRLGNSRLFPRGKPAATELRYPSVPNGNGISAQLCHVNFIAMALDLHRVHTSVARDTSIFRLTWETREGWLPWDWHFFFFFFFGGGGGDEESHCPNRDLINVRDCWRKNIAKICFPMSFSTCKSLLTFSYQQRRRQHIWVFVCLLLRNIRAGIYCMSFLTWKLFLCRFAAMNL